MNVRELHPYDHEMLMDIRRYLIGYRITNGWKQEDLSQRMNHTKGAVYALENGGFNWRFNKLIEWPKPFRLELNVRLELSEHLDSGEMLGEVVEADPIVSVYEQLRHKDSAYQCAYLMAALIKARELKGMTRAQLGRALGISAGGISEREISTDNPMLPNLFAHVRAVGGRLHVNVGKN
jgi:DNA-binding XRE family transcriptional regulator